MDELNELEIWIVEKYNYLHALNHKIDNPQISIAMRTLYSVVNFIQILKQKGKND